MQESLTQKWLRQNIQAYVHKDTVYTHVDVLLSRYPTIRPKTDVYTYDDGRTQLLLCLHGLLPITYRGAPYNIPIAVWLTRDYPRHPPLAYVVPTSDMLVRAGKYLDISGKCEIEYIRNWERKSEGCNLSALLEAMQDYFSREPPVYAKPKQSPTPQPQSRRPDSTAPDYSERPPPPIPPAHPTPPPMSQSVSASGIGNDDRPPLPQKPGIASLSSPASIPSSPQVAGQSQPPHIPATPALALRPPPPLPPHPEPDAGLPRYRTSPVPPRYHPSTHRPSSSIGQVSNSPGTSSWSPDSSVEASTSQRVASPPVFPDHTAHVAQQSYQTSYGAPVISSEQGFFPPQASVVRAPPPPINEVAPSWSAQPQPQYPSAVQPPFISPQGTGNSHRPYQPPPPPPLPPVIGQVTPPAAPQPPPTVPPPDLLDDDNYLSSLTSTSTQIAASPAPAPPRPPNPELLQLHGRVHAKMTSELASLSQAMALDAERLRAHQKDLLAGEPAIRDEMARLEAVRDVCQNVAGRLGTVVADGERNVAELRRKGDPEVDELVCSTTIVHNQLINLVAEDNAIEDTIYHLHRALNAGRIDLERFLRTTRALAEEQFTKRALIEKILNGIPMGETVEWR
ncbi:unnamed protein product [Somion occarium]|uniref:UEV-domain-containing protein n=1 Tax=Somion occarium TaxID=3059160 RepID=A0ABP1DCT8_9APHY